MSVARTCLALFVWLGAAVLPARAAADKGLEGIWQGTLEAGGIKVRLVFHVSKKDGKRLATLDSPDQGVTGVPLDEVEDKDGRVRLGLKKGGFAFEGKLKPDGSALEGDWKQAGQSFPLTLRRVQKAPEIARPQHPKKPYPYQEEEVAFENRKAGVKLVGTLTLPRGRGPFPAVVLISGSGAHDRDETIFGHKPFLVLADHLTRQGIAVLRCDDRGVGGSTGKKMQTTTTELAGDALAAVAFLKGRKDIAPKRIGLIGHSEGGLIAPLAASRSEDVAFIVLLAGTGLPGEDILYLQGQAILKAMGAPEKLLADQRAFQEAIFGALRKEKDNDKARKLIDEALKKLLEKKSPEERKEAEKVKDAAEAQLRMVFTPWFRYFLTYDPRPALRKVRVPVLALVGEKDVQVPPKENVKAIAAALAEGGNKDHTVKELAGLNHLFQTCKTGSLAEYARSEETFAPSALKLISDWILQRAGGERR